jgi:predicted  nucleic acid-binding Zn-ribbon protein
MSKTALAWAAVSCALLVALVWQSVSQQRQLRELQREKSVLAEQISKLKARPVPAPAPPQNPPAEPPTREKSATNAENNRTLALKDESISNLQSDLAASRARVNELENTVLTLQNQNAAMDQQKREEAAGNEATCNQRVSAIQQSLDTLQADLATEKSKAAELQEAKTRLQTQLATPKRSAADAELMASWRDLTRRREGYLRSVARRYRDISSQYRAFSAAQSGRQEQQTGPWNSPELTRIQGEITSAEDDLRQLDQLNDRAALMEKEFAKR